MSRSRTTRYDDSHGDSDPHERLRALTARVGAVRAGAASTGVPLRPRLADAETPNALPVDAAADGAELVGAELTDAGPTGGWVPDQRAPGLAERLTSAGPWGALAERWVPEQLRTARFDPSRRGAIALSALAAVAAIASAVGVWVTRPQPVPVSDGDMSAVVAQDMTVEMGPVEPAGGAAPTEATEPDPGPIIVSVTGAVANPGLVTLPADARVADAIAAAGGARDDADLVGLNLAAHLSDGSSIVVAGPAGSVVSVEEGVAAAAGSSGTSLINLNTADLTQLQQLSGVGPVTAQAIVTYREDHGPFTSIDQLEEVPGIGPATRTRLEPLVTW